MDTNFVNELNSPRKLDPNKKERIKREYIDTFIQCIKAQCMRRKFDHEIEGEFIPPDSEYGSSIQPRKKSEITTKRFCPQYAPDIRTESGRAETAENQRDYDYYYSPIDLKEQISRRLRELGFTHFEIEFIRREWFLKKTYDTLWGSTKYREVPIGRYEYALYVHLYW